MKKSTWPFPALFNILFVLLMIGCAKNEKPSHVGPDRPANPWAFRSVLDLKPRILTLALHDDVWAAYRTDSCSLYKVWKGHVHLQGAVYDNAHGPQPISIGDSWLENKHPNPWRVTQNGQDLLQEVKYKGHSLKDGQATLEYQLVLNNGTNIEIHERPEAIANKDGQVGFERVFTIVNAPPGYEISIAENVNSVALHRNIETNGDWKIDSESKEDIRGKQVLTLDGRLTLKQDGETFFRTLFISTPMIDNPNSLGADEKTLSLGERLIAKNDCKTCHNAKVQTVGPSYLQIAKRYPMDQSEIERLTTKIIKGGGGIWGSQVMSAHPELPVPDAKEMVRYILSLDTTDVGQKGGQGVAVELVAEL
ncbi:MAG: c-type cytochrome, partial [Cyclobacteriaceae bacterium]